MPAPHSDRFNLTSYFLDRHLEEGRGARVALRCGDATYTYADLSRMTAQVGHVLRDLGVGHGDRVLLALSDGVEFVATWYAVPKIGAVVAEAYTFLQPKDYAYFLSYTQPAVVVTDASTRERLNTGIRALPTLPRVLVVGDVNHLATHEVGFDRSVGNAPTSLDAADTTLDDQAIWKFTTGTTGAPKAAVHTHRSPLHAFQTYAMGVLDLGPDDLVLPVPKLFFGYGRDLATLFPFGVGAAGMIFPERSTPERIFQLIHRYKPTVLVNVPTMIHEMNHAGEGGRDDLGSLRLCISSGEALPLEVHRQWIAQFGVEVLEGIGSSELYHIYISNRSGDVRPGSAGRLVPGYEAAVLDPEGRPLPDGEIGALSVTGASRALMYWNDPEKSRRTFVDGWVRTGDLFRRDREGFFWYQGRTDDLLKVGGIWVAPLEVEACLGGHPAVRECAVVGAERDGLVLLRAHVVLADSGQASPEVARALQEFVREHLSPHKAPREVRFERELPRTATGKVDRRVLRSR